MPENIGETIKHLRLNAGYESLGELSRASTVPVSTLSRIENNIQRPSTETLYKLAPYLRVPYEWLLSVAGYLPKNNKAPQVDQIPPKAKKIVDSLARADHLNDDDYKDIADHVERLIELAKFKKRSTSKGKKK